MRGRIVTTVLRREWSETVRNRLLMSTILIPPVVLTIAPLVLAGVVGQPGAAAPARELGPRRSDRSGRRSARPSSPGRSRSSSSWRSSC